MTRPAPAARRLIAPILAVAALALALPAAAQTWDPGPAAAWRHQRAMEQMRARADERAAFIRQQQLNSRLTVLELQAARPAEPMQPPTWRALRSPEEERVLRESATTRRRETTSGVTQIDAWLDRAPQ